MRSNEKTVLVGEKVVLVPYTEQHVPQYHTWMLDAELRRLTASEPLSLEEEFAMQRKWQQDDDKLTSTILARLPKSLSGQSPPDIGLNPTPLDETIRALPMVGDVNLFLKGDLSRYNATVGGGAGDDSDDEPEAEVEVMIAENAYRGKGLAREALQLMLSYATAHPPSLFTRGSSLSPVIARDIANNTDALATPAENDQANEVTTLVLNTETRRSHDDDDGTIPALLPPLPIPPRTLTARIAQTNYASLQLFSLLGFTAVRVVEVFGEVEMRWVACNE